MCCHLFDQMYTAPSSGIFQRLPLPPQACELSLSQLEKQSPFQLSDLVMFFFYQKKIRLQCFFIILNFVYFQAIQTAVFYQKKTLTKSLGLIFSCFQTMRCLATRIQVKAVKLTIKKWPKKVGRMDSYGLENR